MRHTVNHPAGRAAETSPAGAIREQAVPCTKCSRLTFNNRARCWCCIDEEIEEQRLDELERHDGEARP